ncbi:hypothetical protein DICPUDRAFT_98248 [Dictyostelium purpureum]|uniref:Uncharacterized protein n=1 Tax=Dictyostelium purpureum TaxID=5786 RepID=F0ZNX2_DICPU|nr:uncharacterized protein DICPUDRAFT_98248 [Dictyostelium purpureum]EGC34366.1 hypothetical protein DICPUDRAFT_98248 [Dictyostelium purpureum]|eukprot:XP_003289100.1 hypothetical protein DICPUDRAFT_98248 [Dictyostelium purpureum]
MSIFQRVKKFLPKRIRDIMIPQDEGLFPSSYRFPSPGSQAPPEVTNKQFVKTRPLTRVYKFLKKRGEVLSMRPAPKYLDNTPFEQEELTPKEKIEKDYYETQPFKLTPPRILNNKVFFQNEKIIEGFDIRNIKSLQKNMGRIENPYGVQFDRVVLDIKESEIDTDTPIPKTTNNIF